VTQTPSAAPYEMLWSAEDLARRVRQLAEDLEGIFAGAEEPPVFVGLLKGSSMFMADLIRAARFDLAVDFMAISSYRSAGAQSGVVRIVKDLEEDVSDRDLVLVEDIVDTGLTLNYLRHALLSRKPRSLRVVTLLDKSARRLIPVPLDLVGFEVPDVFVVGYGLDFQGLYRNLPHVGAVLDPARLLNDPYLLVEALFASD
jgi:hypoxanthine phosphoribosyltransferase